MSQIQVYKTSGGGGSGTVTSITAGTGLTGTPNPITTSGTIALTVPVTVPDGGTGATSLTGVLIGNGTSAITGNAITQYDVLVGGSSNAISSISPSTAGFVLTSNGTSANPSFQAAVGGGITTIDGDSGSATGSTITFNANSNCGSSVEFIASSATVDLQITDSNLNTLMGSGSGNGSISGNHNTGIGYQVGNSLTSGTQNCFMGYWAGKSVSSASNNNFIGTACGQTCNIGANNVVNGSFSFTNATSGSNNTVIGFQELYFLTTGSYNIAIGSTTGGGAYTTSESSNIILNSDGVVGESNVLRIGSATGTGNKQLNAAYISGINGNTVSSAQMVTIDSATDQLGTQPIPGIGTNVFLAYMNANQANITGDGTQATVIFNSVTSNPGSYYSTSTGEFTAPVTGNYFFIGNIVTYESSASGSTRFIILAEAPGGSIEYKIHDGSYTPDVLVGENFYIFNFAARLTASQTVYVQVRGLGGSKTIGVAGSGGGSQYVSTFSGYYVSS